MFVDILIKIEVAPKQSRSNILNRKIAADVRKYVRKYGFISAGSTYIYFESILFALLKRGEEREEGAEDGTFRSLFYLR